MHSIPGNHGRLRARPLKSKTPPGPHATREGVSSADSLWEPESILQPLERGKASLAGSGVRKQGATSACRITAWTALRQVEEMRGHRPRSEWSPFLSPRRA